LVCKIWVKVIEMKYLLLVSKLLAMTVQLTPWPISLFKDSCMRKPNKANLAKVLTKQISVCWNSIVGRIFGYHKWESVRPLICELRRLNIVYELLVRKAKFYKRLYCKSGFPDEIFWMFSLSDTDECMIDIFK